MGKQFDGAMPDPGTYGACRYCGQIYRVSDEALDDEQAVELATMQCDCNSAQDYAKMVYKMRDVEKMMITEFGVEGAGEYILPRNLVNAITEIGKAVLDGDLKTCKIKIDDCKSISISEKDFRLKVQKNTQTRETKEV